MIWFTSDLHLSHPKILEYEAISRLFQSLDEMNETIISNWNKVVDKSDTVYVLGDFIMGDTSNVEKFLSRLKGKIILVRGNHDTPKKIQEYERLGIEVKDIAYIPYKGRFFICCHFPIASEEFLDMVRKDNSECIILYGHVHSNASKGYIDGTYHIGVDTNDLTPISIQQIWDESWPADIMTPKIEEYKKLHDTHPDLKQMACGAPVGNPAAAAFDLNALQQGYNNTQVNIEFHSENEKEIINNIYKQLIKEKSK